MQFRAGQHIIAGLKGELDQREYSIYSGEQDDYIEILVREVLHGNISVKLKHSRQGGEVQINGPFGSFMLEPSEMYIRKLVFIATGTGISPFHSFIRSYPALDYVLIHGIRYKSDAYDREEYDAGRYIPCTSQESNDGRRERVTNFLLPYRVSSDMVFYVCGNGGMIYDVSRLLESKGVTSNKIFSEVYF